MMKTNPIKNMSKIDPKNFRLFFRRFTGALPQLHPWQGTPRAKACPPEIIPSGPWLLTPGFELGLGVTPSQALTGRLPHWG